MVKVDCRLLFHAVHTSSCPSAQHEFKDIFFKEAFFIEAWLRTCHSPHQKCPSRRGTSSCSESTSAVHGLYQTALPYLLKSIALMAYELAYTDLEFCQVVCKTKNRALSKNLWSVLFLLMRSKEEWKYQLHNHGVQSFPDLLKRVMQGLWTSIYESHSWIRDRNILVRKTNIEHIVQDFWISGSKRDPLLKSRNIRSE